MYGPIRRRSDALPLDLLINFLPGITRVGARDCEGGFGIIMYAYTVMSLIWRFEEKGPSIGNQKDLLQNNLRLAGKDAVRIPCCGCMTIGGCIATPETDSEAFIRVQYSFYSPNCTHSTKSCRAVARVDTGLSKKIIGVPMW